MAKTWTDGLGGGAENTFLGSPKANIIGQRAALSARTEMSDNGKRGEEGPGTGVVVKAKPKTKKPSMYISAVSESAASTPTRLRRPR